MVLLTEIFLRVILFFAIEVLKIKNFVPILLLIILIFSGCSVTKEPSQDNSGKLVVEGPAIFYFYSKTCS